MVKTNGHQTAINTHMVANIPLITKRLPTHQQVANDCQHNNGQYKQSEYVCPVLAVEIGT